MKIPRGSTQDGVNAAVIEEIRTLGIQDFKLLDVPCGQGEFLLTTKQIFPHCSVMGMDLYATPLPEIQNSFRRSSVTSWSLAKDQNFQIITCISGVMCFDSLDRLFKQASAHLPPGGIFIVTNDNITTVRDRLSFLLFGRVKRFEKVYGPDEGNWNMVPIQALWKLYASAGFEVKKVRYTSLRLEDWAFLPLAMILYPFELFALWRNKSPLPWSERVKLFPFWSLLARHYLMVGRKVSNA